MPELAAVHLDPSLYGVAATVIPVFWLSIVYQARGFDMKIYPGPPARLFYGTVVITAITLWGEMQAFASLFDTHHARMAIAQSSVAYALWITAWIAMILPLLPLAAFAAEKSGNELHRLVGVLIVLAVPPVGLLAVQSFVHY